MKKTIFFDFGGCLDAPGIHTRKLFWNGALEAGFSSDGREDFQEAYSKADQKMMLTGEARYMGLSAFNFHNAKLILTYLDLLGKEKIISDFVTSQMNQYLENSRLELEKHKGQYNYGIISNFTGNLEVILSEYKLLNLFSTISESFYVGAAKPSQKIFFHALDSAKVNAKEAYYIGDNPKNDIIPGNEIGFQTVLIFDGEEYSDCGAKYYVRSLEDFFSRIQRA